MISVFFDSANCEVVFSQNWPNFAAAGPASTKQMALCSRGLQLHTSTGPYLYKALKSKIIILLTFVYKK
jgi:hypothetical protein